MFVGKNIRQLFSIVKDFCMIGRFRSFLYVFLVLVKALVPLIQTFSVAAIVRNLHDSSVYFWLIVVIVCLLYENIHYKILDILEIELRYRFERAIGARLIETSCRIEYSYFENNQLYDKVAIAKNGAAITFNAFRTAAIVAERLISVFSLLVYLTSLSVFGAVLMIVVLAVGIFIYSKTATLSWKSQLGTTELEREIAYTFGIITSRTSIAEMKLFRAHVPLKRKYIEKVDALSKIQLSTMGKNLFLQNISSLVLSLISVVMVLFYVSMLFSGKIALDLFAGILTSIINVQSTVSVLGINFSNFVSSFMKYSHLQEFYQIRQNELVDSGRTGTESNWAIEVEQAFFAYQAEAKSVLNGITMKIRKGEFAVIVGENGCGKSTLIKLILGLYQPDQGEIRVFGEDAGALFGYSAPRILAVFQDYVKYNLSVREILCGARNIDDETLYAVLKQVGLDAKVRSMPNGLDTVLGKRFINSTDLSEGQWQKLNIARVILSDAEILIFDEPTASLDPKAEAAFYDEIVKLKGNKTLIAVSHRLGISSIADKVYLCSEGKLIGNGSHTELLSACEAYNKMYYNQAKWYMSAEQKGEMSDEA